MKPNSYQKKKLEYAKPPPSKTWKKLYACHKSKGDHTLELVKPKHMAFFFEKYGHIDVESYYKNEEEKQIECLKTETSRSGWCKVLYHFECTTCGKRALSFTREGKKLI